MRNNSKIVLCLLFATLLTSAVVYAASVSTYTQTISWTKENQSFSINNPTTVDYGIIDLGTPEVHTETYTVTNTGNSAINVEPTVTVTGATYSWDKTTALIPVTGSTTFTLTLTITDSGSCTVTFHIL
jgi:hypothetical protein